MKRLLFFLLAALSTLPARSAQIACTAAAFKAEIAAGNAAGAPRTITFNCTGTPMNKVVIKIPASTTRAELTVNFPLTMEGQNIKFVQDPPGTTDEGGLWFMKLAKISTIRGVEYDLFSEGIQAQADGIVLDGVTCDRPGDDCASNPKYHDFSILNSHFSNANDKCIQISGNNPKGSLAFDSQIINTTFTNCSQPMRSDESVAGGRHFAKGNTFIGTDGGEFECDGPRFTDNAVHIWEVNKLLGCYRGLRLGGSTELISRGDLFQKNLTRGISVYGWAKALVQGDTFDRNGGQSSADPVDGQGGVAVGQTGCLDLGGGGCGSFDGRAQSSTGGNIFTGNISAPSDAPRDIHNLRSIQVKAENNWFGSATTPAARIVGSVDFAPWLTTAPGGGPITQTCGNSIKEGTEFCDDGNAVTETACPYGVATCAGCISNCLASNNLIGPRYGDGIVNGPEQCDGAAMGTHTCNDFIPGCTTGALTCNQGVVAKGSCAACVGPPTEPVCRTLPICTTPPTVTPCTQPVVVCSPQ